jgi:hypothetical protein
LVELARGPGGIENELHGVKDVVMGEDACRVMTKGDGLQRVQFPPG